jgi:hypothetical protein
MSTLPEREAGIFRMALDVGYATDWMTELQPGRTRTSRDIGRLTLDIEFEVKTKVEDRWLERCWVKIVYEGLEVFDAWQSRLLGDKEPHAGLVLDFLPGPWETHLANLWKAEREPS